MRTIWILKGIPASGKSTWAAQQMNKYRGKFKRFNRDDMRALMDGDYRSPECEDFIVQIRNENIEIALRLGYDVILDDTNFNYKNFLDMCDIAERIGDVRVIEKFFEVTLKDAIRNNSKRNHPIPEHIIRSIYEKHVEHSRVEVRDVFFPAVVRPHVVPTEKKPNAIICDLDGTLALAFDRDYYDNTQVETDTINEFVLRQISLHVERGDLLIFVSGRPQSAQEATERWIKGAFARLYENGYLSYSFLFGYLVYLRGEEDKRPDAVVKKEIYEQHIKDIYNIVAVYDDRRKVVRTWTKLGLPVFQVYDTII